MLRHCRGGFKASPFGSKLELSALSHEFLGPPHGNEVRHKRPGKNLS